MTVFAEAGVGRYCARDYDEAKGKLVSARRRGGPPPTLGRPSVSAARRRAAAPADLGGR